MKNMLKDGCQMTLHKCSYCDGRGTVYMALHTPPVEIGCSNCEGRGYINDDIYSWVINTHDNLNYLKLAIQSIRENAFYKKQPIIVYCENDLKTYEWLKQQSDIETVYEENIIPKGIGGGVNIAINRVKTKYFNLIHSDFYIAKNYDKALYDCYQI